MDELEEIKRKLQALYKKDVKSTNPTEPIKLTDLTFDEEVRRRPLILVDFTAVWCGPCLMMKPILKEIAEKYAGRLVVGELDVDQNLRTAQRFQIRSVPTFILVKNGTVVDHFIGAMPAQHLEERIEKHLQ